MPSRWPRPVIVVTVRRQPSDAMRDRFGKAASIVQKTLVELVKVVIVALAVANVTTPSESVVE